MNDNNVYDLWFSLKKGIAPLCKKELIENIGSSKTLYFMNSDEIDELKIDKTVKCALMGKDLTEAKKVFLECNQKEIDVIFYTDEFYPPLLREIRNPPMLLYKKGLDLDYRKLKLAAVVGSRSLSSYGQYVTEKISTELALSGFTIVSGMALGADFEAHKSAINASKMTVAVLGCGVDVVYPFQNQRLYDYILKRGAIISEYLPGTEPTKYTFPQRNRIISGMSHFIVVTEARFNSGSLITAKEANMQGKKVFAIPQNINSPYGQGTNHLLKEYATIITEGADALDYYIRTYQNSDYTETLRINMEESETQSLVDPYENLMSTLNETEKSVINVLKKGITHINKISSETGYPISKVNAIVSLLEIRGIVYSVMGSSYGMCDPKVWFKGTSKL